ncbi:MAG: hypothetical protein QM669_05035 [Siphonobacter sp.]
MKTIIKSFALLFALSASVLTASANSDKPKSAPAENEITFKSNVFKGKMATQYYCFVDKEPGQRLTITIRDNNNKVLSEQYISKNSTHVAELLDLSQLADGDYSLSVSDANRMVVHPVRIATTPKVKYVYVDENVVTD